MTIFSYQYLETKPRVYFWDRKENLGQTGVSLSELLLFFKIKQFSNLKEISNSYDDFEYWEARIQTIFRSFANFPMVQDESDIWKCVPRQIAEAYNEAREQVLTEALVFAGKQFPSVEDFEKVQDFFQNQFPGRVIEKMDYPIRTSTGSEDISLTFAENFRFKTVSGSFHLFGLKKELRDMIVPADDDSVLFVADFRQFEFRTFLKLQGMDSFLDDDNLYQNLGKELGMSSSDLKVEIISYLYGQKEDRKLESFFQKKRMLARIEDERIIYTEEGPVFVPSEDNAGKQIHTLVQTVSQYVYLKKLDKILNLLHNKQSKFIFPLHDSVIISLRRDEPEVFDEILEILEDKTYKIKCYMGANFRDAQEI